MSLPKCKFSQRKGTKREEIQNLFSLNYRIIPNVPGLYKNGIGKLKGPHQTNQPSQRSLRPQAQAQT
jgi:hypothetical protein